MGRHITGLEGLDDGGAIEVRPFVPVGSCHCETVGIALPSGTGLTECADDRGEREVRCS